MNDWVTVKASELSSEEPKRSTRGHGFVRPKKMQWLCYCRYCGHLALKNDVSKLVTKVGCDFERDPRFLSWKRRQRSTSCPG